MKIVLLGGSGQLGTELQQTLHGMGELFCPTRAELDLLEIDTVTDYMRRLAPSVVVNAAAYTAVDAAEGDVSHAQWLNTELPQALAETTVDLGARLIHYSTDYVFDGKATTPYPESVATAPLGVYGRTKRDGDEAVLRTDPHAIILRVAWIYGAYGKNFLKTVFRLADEGKPLRIVNDQVGVPTWSRTVAEVTAQVLATEDRPDRRGLFHFAPKGSTTWWGFAQAALKARGGSEKVDPIPTDAYPTRAVRPRYSVMDASRLEQAFGIVRRSWEEDLQRCVQTLPLVRSPEVPLLK